MRKCIFVLIFTAITVNIICNQMIYGASTEEEDKIKEARELLKSKDSVQRLNGIYMLQRIGTEEAISVLGEVLNDKDKGIRLHTVLALSKIGSLSVIPLLKQALKDEDYYIREQTVKALREIGGEAVIPALAEATKDESLDIAVSAITGLGKIGHKSAIPTLEEALKDKRRDVRMFAIESLGKIGDKSATFVVIKALKDKDKNIRISAIIALGRIGDPKAIKPLMQVLKNKEEDNWIRNQAHNALEKIGKPAVPMLIKALKSKDETVYSYAIGALAEIGDPRAIPPLVKLLKKQRGLTRESILLRVGIVTCLFEIGKDSIPSLKEVAEDKKGDELTRSLAVFPLYELGDKSAIPIAIALGEMVLKDKSIDSKIRSSVIGNIGRICDKAIIPVLEKALEDEDKDVREAAAEYLDKIRKKSLLK